MACSLGEARDRLRGDTGIVVPVYIPPGVDGRVAEELLADTTAGLCAEVNDPLRVCLSVDGAPFGGEAAAQIAAKHGLSLLVGAENRGKMRSVRDGVRRLFDLGSPRYVAIVDQDGDHFPNELLNFVRAGEDIAAQTCDPRVLVLGRRLSRHRPMGFLRGELEELADRVLLDALAYRAAITGKPLRLEYAHAFDEFPDFHSGYKLFSRRTAEDVFLREPHLCGVAEDCYYRHAVEAVMVVEALEANAYLGVVNRSTINEQPVSTFGLFNRSRLVADKMIWPSRRLGIPAAFVGQWLSNHMPRLELFTMAPDGRKEIERIRDLVLAACTDDAVVPSLPTVHPAFV